MKPHQPPANQTFFMESKMKQQPHECLVALSPRALRFWSGNKTPELSEAAAMFSKAGDLLNHRRAIVRQMQIDNITKPKSLKRIAK
jgi:hypothetical protein